MLHFHAFTIPIQSPRWRVIVTLDPNKFAEKKQGCLHIGNLQTLQVSVVLRNQSSPVGVSSLYYERNTSTHTEKRLCYLPYIKPFLYYCTLLEKPPIAAICGRTMPPSYIKR